MNVDDLVNLPREQSQRGLAKTPDIASWCYVPVWRRSALPERRPIMPDEVCLVFEDQQDIGGALCQRLAKLGCAVVRVRPGTGFARSVDGIYTIDPAVAADYDAVLAALEADAVRPSQIVHLWSLDASTADHEFDRAKDLTFYSVLFLTQVLVRRGIDAIDLAVVGSGWAAVERHDDIQPAMAPLPAFCTVITQEHPGIRTAAIDVTATGSSIAGIADQIVTELRAEFDGIPVAYRGPQRWVQAYERVATATGWCGALRTRGVYVITGGLGHVGLALADYLARKYSARLVLLARNVPPPTRDWENWLRTHDSHNLISQQILALRRIEAAGAEVLVRSVDVSDGSRLRDIFAEVSEWFGRIDGVIHAAGETAGSGIGPITSLDRAGCEAQFRPKIQGLPALADAVSEYGAGFCALTSSLSGVLGGPGLGANAAANRYMDAFAEATNSRGARWLSIASDAWAFTEADSTPLELAMTTAEGVRAIERAIESMRAARAVISIADLDARLDCFVRRAPRQSRPPATLTEYTRSLAIDYEAPADDVERMIAEVWQDMIGIERVGRSDDFFKLGGHSLLATRVIAQIKQRCGVELGLRSFFECLTLSALAGRVRELQWANEGRAASVGLADREEIEI